MTVFRLMLDTYFGLILDAPSMREMSMAEQRYLAVLAVIADGHDVTAAAQQCKPPRVLEKTLIHPFTGARALH